MYTLPAESTEMPVGPDNSALVASPPSPAIAPRSIPGNRRDDAFRYFADSIADLPFGNHLAIHDVLDSAAALGDVDIASRIHRHGRWGGQLRLSGRAAIATKPVRSIARYGSDYAVGDLAEAVVAPVGEVDVAGDIHRDAPIFQLRGSRGAAIPAVALRSIPGHRRDHVVRHSADTVVVSVDDVEIAYRAHSHRVGITQLRAGGWSVIAAEAACSISRYGGDDAI
jgi:hypothetical protein